MATKVIFLDRDGTINVDSDKGYVYKISEWEFTPRAPEALKMFQDAGYTLTVITNQSGIGHGLYSEEDMHRLHEHMNELLSAQGVTIAALAFCPHGRESTCDCRKPKIGMSKHVEERIGAIDYAHSWTIGDKIKDVEFGHNTGTYTALLKSRFWTPENLSIEPTLIADSLYEAAQKIVTM